MLFTSMFKRLQNAREDIEGNHARIALAHKNRALFYRRR